MPWGAKRCRARCSASTSTGCPPSRRTSELRLGLSSAECRGVDTIASDAPDLAAEIGRRLAQLLSCKALLDAGFVLDPGSAFLDEAPADPQKVAEALTRFRESLEADPGMNGNHDDMQRAVLALSQLGGAEMDAAVAGLEDGELRGLNGAVYEKAFAQYRGSYGAIEGGHRDWAMPVITGNAAERQPPSDFTLEEVATRIGAGDVMTLGTTDDKTLWWGDEDQRIAGGRIVSNHEYVVQSVDLDATPPTITMLNPWGSTGSAKHIVTVTESEFHQHFDGISIGRADS